MSIASSLAEDDHPIALLAGNRPIVELGDHLFEQMDRLEASLSDDLRLDPFGLLAGRCLDRVSRRSFQETVRLGRQLVGPGLEDVVGRISEDEADVPRIVPGIQILGLGDCRASPRQDLIVPRIQVLVLGDPRVSPQQDLAEAGPNAKRDGLVQVLAGPLLRRAIAAAIEQEQGFGRIGQRDQERMVAPPAVVGDVHALLALGVGLGDGAIGVQDRLIEELLRLLSPDPQPRFIDGDSSSRGHRPRSEAAAEVPGGGRVWDSFGSQGIEVDLVVAPQFEVFDPLAAGEDIEGDVQDVVGFVVGEMPLEQMRVARRSR